MSRTMTPLRAAAYGFAARAGYPNHEVRLQESVAAHHARNPAYSVYVRAPGAARGRCIGAILLCMVYP